MKKITILAMASAVLLSGCSIRVADLTVGSTKNYNINGNKFVTGQRVTAEDSYPVIIFPTGIPNMKTAIDKAIEKDKCAVGLSNVVITQLNHAFLFGKIGLRAEGNLIIDKSLPGCENHA
ncbi:TPA: hypothetical protein ON183_003011 [Serratia marcescens]|uniref:hypothetical protein n=1 Tax=Serratia TaxID=613 RepID=UPI000499567E|nr:MULTISPECIES: hypothetical protein [Serratia]AIA46706.1 hypothetical protein L085_06275 [Serratia sp. FS14]HAT4997484.1 hypothetical protein [Serratia marcescens]HAT5019338.1 hypothetical protein [Serratia marcescens]HCR2983405.1 hypothetical protein [Serratia marcescens]HCR2989355.1 hypothetical protein [Serratia marcescens]